MALLTRARRHIGRIFHVAHPTPKHVENSQRGDRRAKRHGYGGTDLDILITRDNRIVNTHWDRPMLRDGFRDPWRMLSPGVKVREMTWRQVSRLVAGRRLRRYRIRSIEAALLHCARLGIVAVLEPKGDKRFELDWPWGHIAAVAEDVGCTVSVRALRDYPSAGAGTRRVAAARRAGFKAWTI